MMENAQKKEKLDVRARSYKEGRPRWVGFIQDGSYLVGKAMPAHGMPKPSPTEGTEAVEGTGRAREGCFIPDFADSKKAELSLALAGALGRRRLRYTGIVVSDHSGHGCLYAIPLYRPLP